MLIGGFFTTILFIVLFLLGLRILLWLIFPKMFVRNQNSSTNSNDYQKKEGEINIDYIPKKEKKIKNDTGDYTDFEELE